MNARALLGELLTLALVSGLCAAAWLGGEGEAYLFPRLISVAMLAIALGVAASAMLRRGGVAEAIDWPLIAPALLIGAVYLAALEWLGFYTSSALAFFAIGLLYGGGGERRAAAVARCALITLAFVVVLYLVFSLGLRVQTPRGWLI